MSTPSVAPNDILPGPGGERSPNSAPDQGTGISDIAVVPLADLFQRLHSTDAGLSASAAAAVFEAVGPNQIAISKKRGLLADFLGRLSNPLVLILLFAATVSAFTGDVASFVIIATIVLMSVILDVAQERQAQNAAERLRAQVSLSAKALRDGKPFDIPAAEIVPGDVVLLTAGDLVPGDSRLIESRDLYVDEALLTGEPYPAEKDATAIGAGARETAFPLALSDLVLGPLGATGSPPFSTVTHGLSV